MVSFFYANSLRNIWPFSILKTNDNNNQQLVESNEIVHKLSLPDTTKSFVFAIRVHEHDSTIYLLSAQNLSHRSASDAESLIREIRPGLVLAQLNRTNLEEEEEVTTRSDSMVPTSAFGVVKQCFVDKISNKEKFQSLASFLVMKEIFGTSFNGHVLAAENVAKEVGSSFTLLESIPFGADNEEETETQEGLIANSLMITNDAKSHMLKLLVSNEIEIESNDDSHDLVPPFAINLYAFLVDLQDVFSDLQSIRTALVNAKTMLSDVNRGETIDAEVVSQVRLFNIAIEGLRIVWNNVGRSNHHIGSPSLTKYEFLQLSSEERSYALTTDLLRTKAKEFKTIVAVVDASSLHGLRKHWLTCVPQEVKDMSLIQDSCNDDEEDVDGSKVKPVVVAVGAGAATATTMWCVSSLSKAITASPLLKIVTLKSPASLKAMTYAFTKVAGTSSSKAMAPSMVKSTTTSFVKASLSREKLRAMMTQGAIASAEKTSFSATRGAFYEIMRKRRAIPIGKLPLATFGASFVTCVGLLCYEEEIECAVVSLPSAYGIAKLGQGVRNLRDAAMEVRGGRESNRIHDGIEAIRQKTQEQH
ncbi:unnamed protein product [Cochlearia groenlandica]